MKALLLNKLISILLGMLSPELLKGVIDAILDWIEEAVEDSETKIDDKMVLPLIAMIRTAFDIPDED